MHTNDKDAFFASPFIIELSNCILNVISLINEPIENTKTSLIEEMKLFIIGFILGFIVAIPITIFVIKWILSKAE